jgi:hypothetical protein
MMELGTIVVIRSSGRRARIVERIGADRYQVEYMTDPEDDPIDRDTVQTEEQRGIYHQDDLAPAE